VNPREKMLAAIVGGMVGLFALGVGVRAMFVGPLRDADKKIRNTRFSLEKVQKEKRAFFAAEDAVKKVVAKTFSHDVDEASALSGEMITGLIRQAGLREADFSRLPVGPRRLRGAREIGWSVRGSGAHADVVDLIYLLKQAPAAHRIESLTMSSSERSGKVRVSFRWLTLVVTPEPIVERSDLKPVAKLDSDDRRVYDAAVERDVFRPYIKRPPAPPPPPNPPSTPPPSGPPPAWDTFQVVSPSEWQGRPEVHVRDLKDKSLASYGEGDELAGGKIVAVDYRPLPHPAKPGLKSHSRVIVRIGEEFWAVERGQTLADKRQLNSDQLPEKLSKL